jgi:hypothetical protein
MARRTLRGTNSLEKNPIVITNPGVVDADQRTSVITAGRPLRRREVSADAHRAVAFAADVRANGVDARRVELEHRDEVALTESGTAQRITPSRVPAHAAAVQSPERMS